MSAPTLETKRLILRAHRVGDFDASVAMWGDEAVTRFIGGRPSTPEETWSRLLRYAGHWALLDFGYWAVLERASMHFVGEVGFADFKRQITPAFDGVPEMGWVLVPAAQGRGYASEAISLALGWARDNLRCERTVAMITPENAPSLRVAAKVGFREYSRTVYKGAEVALFEYPLARS